MQKNTFEGRFLSKLSKIDKRDIEGFLSHLVREKNFLEILFNSMVDGIIVLRPNLEVVYSNNMALEMLGVPAKRRVMGMRITELSDNQQFRELIARFALDRERRMSAEIEMPTNPPRHLSIMVIPFEADRDQAAGSVVVMLHDLTEARQHEEQRRRTERAMTMATLAAGLAHEIKNPLNSLQIHAQLLKRALVDNSDKKRTKVDFSRVEQSIDIIIEEIQRLGMVVDQFLTAVRPTKPLFQRTSINTVVERVVATVRPEAEAKDIRLSMILDHDIPAVEVDPNQMAQAILNLVKNAIEALDERRDGQIEVRTTLTDSVFRVRVADNGPGIPEEEMGKILEPYYTTKFTGTGLGLPIVSRIVGEHSGQIDLMSKPGEGTAVTLVFPLDARPVRLLQQAPSFCPVSVLSKKNGEL